MRSRIRQLKPELFLDDEFWELQQAYPRLPVLQGFLGLWCQADREGRFEWKPAVLRTQILPFWSGDFAEVLAVLEGAGLVQSYTVDGRRYGLIRSFAKHQRPNSREPKSSIPEPLTSAQAESVSVHARAQAHARPDTPLPTPDPKPDPDPEALPNVPGLVKTGPNSSRSPNSSHPGPLGPSKREQRREAEAARLGVTPALKHEFDPDWLPSEEHRALGFELGLSEKQILDEAEDCRNKTYTQPFVNEDKQFRRELGWLAADLKKQKHQEMTRRDRDRFETPGSDRAAR